MTGRVLAWLAAIIVGCVAFQANANQTEKIDNNAQLTNDALCALRGDLEVRVKGSTDFLVKHPTGIAGITAAQIQEGIKNQERTIAALSILDCPPAPLPRRHE